MIPRVRLFALIAAATVLVPARWPAAVPVIHAQAAGSQAGPVESDEGSRSGSNGQVAVNYPVAGPSEMSLDSLADGNTFAAGTLTVSGWAINRNATSGTGIDAIHVWLSPATGPGRSFLGVATYGIERSDIGALHGAQFTNSGFMQKIILGPGRWTVSAFAHNAATGAFDAGRSATVTILPNTGLIGIDSPATDQLVNFTFEINGWAIDPGAPSGTGVDAIQIYLHTQGEDATPPRFIANGIYGGARADVGGVYGSRFTNSGYHCALALPVGKWHVIVMARSTVTGWFSVERSVRVTVNSNQQMAIDTPGSESTISAPTFIVAGWSIDQAVATGTGVDGLHVYAYPNPGSGEPPIFLGVATIGLRRDNFFPRFQNAGYELIVDRAAVGMTPGDYGIVVVSHSTSGSFNNLAVVRVTLQ